MVVFGQIFYQPICLFSTLPFKFSTTGCIYDPLGGVIHGMVKDFDLCGQINAMHWASLQQPLVSFPGIVKAFIFSLLEHNNLSSPLYSESMREKSTRMPPPAPPSSSLIHKAVTQTKLIPHLLVKMERASTLSLQVSSHSVSLCWPFSKSTHMLIGVFTGMTSILMLLHHCDKSWLQLKVVSFYSKLSHSRIFIFDDWSPEIFHRPLPLRSINCQS